MSSGLSENNLRISRGTSGDNLSLLGGGENLSGSLNSSAILLEGGGGDLLSGDLSSLDSAGEGRRQRDIQELERVEERVAVG